MEKPNQSFTRKFLAITMAIALLGVALGVALSGNVLGQEPARAESFSAMTALASTAGELDSPFKAVYENVSQSIVGIQLTTSMGIARGRITSQTAHVGSGVVISDDGYVVTNYHVVTANSNAVADRINVVYGENTYPAQYVAGDEDTDIAVLKVEGLTAPAAKLGNSEELSVGDWALVVGNPLGEEFVNTLTVGVISGLNRDMSSPNDRNATSMIQTNAAINAGNSGGGLFNIRGELVGITSMKLSNNGYYGMASIEGIGFAIPINKVTEIADALIEHGKVVYPRIGVVVDQIVGGSEEPTKETLPSSVLVRSVEKDSPADKAGIRQDDLIMKVDGERVKTVAEMQSIIRAHKPGETVDIEVYRIPNVASVKEGEDYPDGEYLTMTVTLEILD